MGHRLIGATREKLAGARRSPGQSLVEFALILPILLLLTMAALDFGRLYLGYINLQNMARVASNFAANNSTAWLTNTPANAITITKYRNQVLADGSATNCALNPAAPAGPTFSDATGDGIATGIGDRASVTFTCRFRLVTPILSGLFGSTIDLTASSVFPVKSGLTGTGPGGSLACLLPSPAINATPDAGLSPLKVTFRDASGGGPGTSWAWAFGDGRTSTLRDPGEVTYSTPGTYQVTLTVSNVCGTKTTPTPKTITVSTASAKLCTVPDLHNIRINTVQTTWTAAGFTTTVLQAAGHSSGNYKITTQSLVADFKTGCGATITVTG